MMVDFITVELPDPVGVPVNDGRVMRVSPEGEIQWETACRKVVEGSWASKMTVRAIGAEYCEDNAALVALGNGRRRSGLELSGNPAKFLNGHNLFGPDCPRTLVQDALLDLAPAIWPDAPDRVCEIAVEDGLLSRIDLTASWLLEREQDVDAFLRAMEQTVWCPWRGRGKMKDIGTLLYGETAKGKRAKDWQLKLYNKGREVTVHKLPEIAYLVPGLLDEVNRTVRVELTLRTAELKRLGLRKVGDWSPSRVREIWETYVSKLDCGDGFNLDRAVEDLALHPDAKPRHLTAVAAWKAGTDMRSIYSSTSTLYRVRNEIMELFKLDIFVPFPRSNVVPLPPRVIHATQLGRPAWADELTRVLQAA